MGAGEDKQPAVVCVPNWLGDAVMAMPALQALQRQRGGAPVAILAKPALVALWRLHGGVRDIVVLESGCRGARQAARELQRLGVAAAYILPNSIRSALVPLLARVPVRVGLRGHRPPGMLTATVRPSRAPERRHQVWEGLAVMGEAEAPAYEAPRLDVPASLREAVRTKWPEVATAADTGPLVAVMPGAARGPAKRWPASHFAAAVRPLIAEYGARAILLGGPAEREDCAAVAHAVGDGAIDLSGATSLPELAAVLAASRAAICNDSGGMHLAAAMGTRVVAVFGLTDPGKTGPLGDGHAIVRREDVRPARAVARDSREARAVLASIAPERVTRAAAAILAGQAPS